MTVNTTDNRVSYTGNGTIPSVPIPFYFLEDADLVVLEVVIATGVQTVKSITTDYAVSGAGDPNGGTVTGVTTLPSTKKWVIYRDPEMTQTVQHVDNDPLSAESIDNPLDKLTMIAQRTREITERSLRQPDGDTDTIGSLPVVVDRAGMYLAFDNDGDPVAAAPPEGGNVVSAFAATLLDDTTAADARDTLGLGDLAVLDTVGLAQIAQAAKLEAIQVACSDETTALAAGTGKVTFRMPYALTLTAVRASLTTAQTSGSIFTVDINESGSSILSTKLTVDNGEKTSVTAATAAVISDTALADDAEITIDIDQIGDGTAKGLKVTLIGYKP